MNIVIFNHHAVTPEMGGGTRHYDFAKELIKCGHTVTIVASSFHYASYKEMKDYEQSPYLQENIDGINFTWIKTPSYSENGIARVKNMLVYMYKAIEVKFKQKPDIIIGSSVHLFAVYAAYRVAKNLNIPFIMEVRDIWPQTLIDMGISKWHPFILILSYLEKFLYKKADKIITLLPYANEHIENFGIKKENIIWISNGVNPANFKSIQKDSNHKNFTITYTGAIGKANAMQTFMDVAQQLNTTHPDIYFKIIGEGAFKQNLITFKNTHKLDNVEILNAVSKTQIPQILKNSDILYVGLKDSPLYRFGISLNKIFDYLCAEGPIIFASNSRNNPIQDANAGITVAPEDKEALKEAILKIYYMPSKERNEYSKNNLNYINNNFSIQFLTNKLENLLNGLLWKKK